MLNEERMKEIENCDCPRCKLPEGIEHPLCKVELLATVREMQERMAELELDAKLGRMVREMPDNTSLHRHMGSWLFSDILWDTLTYYYRRDTPEGALKAAGDERGGSC